MFKNILIYIIFILALSFAYNFEKRKVSVEMKKILSYFEFKSRTSKVGKTEKGYFILFFCFLIGFIVSIAVVGTSANNQDNPLIKLLYNLSEKAFSSSVTISFINSLSANCFWLITSYFFGASAFGYPFIFIMPFIIGIQKGSFLSIILINSGASFFAKFFLLYFFQNSFLILILMMAFFYSLKMSVQTFYMIRGISRFDVEYIDFKKYTKLFILYLTIVIFLSLADSFLINLL